MAACAWDASVSEVKRTVALRERERNGCIGNNITFLKKEGRKIKSHKRDERRGIRRLK